MLWSVTDVVKVALDDDSIDRLHHFFTAIVLFVCLLASSKRQYIGSPINCWCPKHFTKAHIEYTENYCWTRNTYYVPVESAIPQNIDQRTNAEIIYYQWVPCVLLAQIVLFQIPNLVWIHSYPKVGIQIQEVVESANILSNSVDPIERRQQVKVISKHLMQTFVMRGKFCGQSLCYLYILVKCLYLINLLLQFSLVFFFFNGEIPYSFLPTFLDNEVHTRQNHSHFPRTTLCDLVIRELGNLHRHTIQCVLPINRINELIYQIIFVWFSLLLLMTIVSLVRWIIRLGLHSSRIQMISEMTAKSDMHSSLTNCKETTNLLKEFCEKFLRHDGLFILYLLNHNASNITAREITISIWHLYQKRKIKFAKALSTRRRAITSLDLVSDSDVTEDMSELNEHKIYHLPSSEEEDCV